VMTRSSARPSTRLLLGVALAHVGLDPVIFRGTVRRKMAGSLTGRGG
jgi:hypothetical protein